VSRLHAADASGRIEKRRVNHLRRSPPAPWRPPERIGEFSHVEYFIS